MPLIDPIRTQRLCIREFLQSGRDALLAVVREPEQIQYMLPFLETEAALDNFLSMVISSATDELRRQFHFAVDESQSGRYLEK